MLFSAASGVLLNFNLLENGQIMNQTVAQFAPLVLIMVVFYFLIMRPQQKKVGDKVVLAAGFKGRVTKVGEQFFTVDIGQGAKIEVEVERNAIAAKAE